MILDAFLTIIISLLAMLQAALPAWNINLTQIGSPANTALFYDSLQVTGSSPFYTMLAVARRYNDFVPVDQLYLILSMAGTLYACLMGYRFSKWIVGVVRGSGTS